MKVEELIKKLKSVPSDYEVYFASHDLNEYEFDEKVNAIEIVDFSSACNTTWTQDIEETGIILRG